MKHLLKVYIVATLTCLLFAFNSVGINQAFEQPTGGEDGWIMYITAYPTPSCPTLECGMVTPTVSYISLESCKRAVNELVTRYKAGVEDKDGLRHIVKDGIITAYNKDKIQARIGYACLPNHEDMKK